MTLTPDQRIAAIGVSVGLLIPAFPVIWKAAGLRADINSRWKTRVDVTYAGLTEQAIEALRQLQIQANQLLGDMDKFDPMLVVADPAPLAENAVRFNRMLRARHSLRIRFTRELRMMSLAVYLVAAYALGVVFAGIYFDGLYDVKWLGRLGIALTLAALAAGGLLLTEYAYIEHKLSGAEIMSAPPT